MCHVHNDNWVVKSRLDFSPFSPKFLWMCKIPMPKLLISAFLHALIRILISKLKLPDPSPCHCSCCGHNTRFRCWKGSLYICGLLVLKAGNQFYILYVIDIESIKHQPKVTLDVSSEKTINHVICIQVYWLNFSGLPMQNRRWLKLNH